MKEVAFIVYEATDGRRFNTKEECLRYENDDCVKLRPKPSYGGHVPIASQWQWMLGGDGDCYYATETKVSDIRAGRTPQPEWATHVMYFGK